VKFSLNVKKACRGIRGIASHTITLAVCGHLSSTSRPDIPMSGKESYWTGGWCAPDTFWTFWRREKYLAPTGPLVMTYEIPVDRVLLIFLFCLMLGIPAFTLVTIGNSMPVSSVVSCFLWRQFLFIFRDGSRLFEQIQFCNILGVSSV
jgi:hypothetical protein